MSSVTPLIIAQRVAVIITALMVSALSLAAAFKEWLTWWAIVLAGVICFLVVYGILQYTLQKFIYRNISLLFRTIHRLKRNSRETHKDVDLSRDIISEVRKEVVDWQRDHQKEITRLQGLEEYRREFIGNISHELKTPIFNIQGYLLTLLEGGMDDPTIKEKYLQRAEKSVERMIKMIKELDMIIKLDTGGLSMQIEKVNLTKLCQEVLDAQELRARKKNIKLVFSGKDAKPIWVMADEDRINQVMTNLVTNSIRYGKEEGTTEIRFHDIDENILIEVSDDGVGMEDSEAPRVFERFYRTESGRNMDHSGVGLGLSIVKHIIDAHGQHINVRSTPGEGSVFSFTLQKA